VSKDILYKAPFGLPKLIINEVGVDFGDAEANLNDYMNACLKEMINELELAQDFKEKRFIFKSLFQVCSLKPSISFINRNALTNYLVIVVFYAHTSAL